MLLLILVGIAALVGYLHFRISRRRLYELADKVDGPKEFPFLGNAHQFAGNSEHVMNMVRKYSAESSDKNYVFKVWLGPRLYFSIGNPSDAEACLKVFLEKDDLHDFIRPLTGHGLIFAPVPIWKHRRKTVLPAFNKKILDTFVEVFYQQSEILVRLLESKSGQGQVRLCKMLNACTLDSVSETAMGVQMKSQGAKHSPYLEAVDEILQIMCRRIFQIWLQPELLFNATLGPLQHKLIKQIHGFTDEVIQKKKKQHADQPEAMKTMDFSDESVPDCSERLRKPFLDLLMMLSHNKDAEFTDVELREEVLVFIIAGTDTSALGLGYTLTMLGAYPEVQQRAYEEVMEVCGQDGPITKDHISKLQFLDRVIKESLRLYPPVPLIIRKVTEEIQIPTGARLPAGSGAVINIWCLHRNKHIWGEDAEEFRPDRFLEPLKHPFAYMAFSAGSRNCLGYNYATMSMKTVAANILRNYKLTAKPYDRLKLEVMMRPAEGLYCAFEKRQR